MERLSSIVSNRPTVYIHGGIHGLPDDGERSVSVPHEYVVLASSIPPLSPSSTWRLFRGASAVREQLVSTEGVVGFSLLARPLRKQYATLSVWVDERALSAFADGNPHRQLVDDLSPDMGPTKFVRWTIAARAVGRPRARRCSDWLMPERPASEHGTLTRVSRNSPVVGNPASFPSSTTATRTVSVQRESHHRCRTLGHSAQKFP